MLPHRFKDDDPFPKQHNPPKRKGGNERVLKKKELSLDPLRISLSYSQVKEMDQSSLVGQDDLVVKWQDHISHNNPGSTCTPFPLSHATSLLRISQLDFKLLISNLLKKRPLGLKVSKFLCMTGSYAAQKHRCVCVSA